MVNIMNEHKFTQYILLWQKLMKNIQTPNMVLQW